MRLLRPINSRVGTRLVALAVASAVVIAVASAGTASAGIAELALEGKQVRYLRATIVPRDESFLLVVEAASEELVREAYALAGVRFDRISTTFEDEASAVASTPVEPSEGGRME